MNVRFYCLSFKINKNRIFVGKRFAHNTAFGPKVLRLLRNVPQFVIRIHGWLTRPPLPLYLQIFTGNKDRNSIQRNEVPLPTVASSIMIMGVETHANFAVRMELYGCEPGGSFMGRFCLATG